MPSFLLQGGSEVGMYTWGYGGMTAQDGIRVSERLVSGRNDESGGSRFSNSRNSMRALDC